VLSFSEQGVLGQLLLDTWRERAIQAAGSHRRT
jgi:hypothetical protein